MHRTANKIGLCAGVAIVLAGCGGRVDPPKYEGLTFSRDGKQILALYSQSDLAFIYVIPLGTGKAVRFTNASKAFEGIPAFSRDGKRIVYTQSAPEAGANSRIVIGNGDGSDLRPLKSTDRAAWPLFSVDDQTLVFARYGYFGNYDGVAQNHAHAWDFYQSDLDGANVRPITNESIYSVSRPSLSPDGKSLAFVGPELDSAQRHEIEARYKNAPAELAAHYSEMDAEAITIYSLEQPPKPRGVFKPHIEGEPQHGPIYVDPTFMPDGESILFLAASGDPFDYDVYVMNLRTRAVVKLTNQNGHAYSLQVSPDGKNAAFVRQEWHNGHPGTSAIFLLDLATGTVTALRVTGIE